MFAVLSSFNQIKNSLPRFSITSLTLTVFIPLLFLHALWALTSLSRFNNSLHINLSQPTSQLLQDLSGLSPFLFFCIFCFQGKCILPLGHDPILPGATHLIGSVVLPSITHFHLIYTVNSSILLRFKSSDSMLQNQKLRFIF